jgi:hypothetical protein
MDRLRERRDRIPLTCQLIVRMETYQIGLKDKAESGRVRIASA